MTFPKLFAALIAISFISGCATSVKRDAAVEVHASATEKIGAVNVEMTAEAQKKLSDNIKFSQADFAATLARTLEANGLLDKSKPNKLDVSVTDFRVRGTFTAVMFGVLAGTDSVDGTVTIKSADGRVLKKFTVSASYGLGGWGGGQDSTRLNWLYEAFSKKVLEELGASK